MQRVFSFRQGDRAEYLAQYILSSFAISVPVPRQEDVGTDFHCSLLKREGTNLRPYLPFNIQIKSYGKEVLTKGIRFGGLTDAGNWRKHEVEQLCQTDTPFIIGIVNAEKQTMPVHGPPFRAGSPLPCACAFDWRHHCALIKGTSSAGSTHDLMSPLLGILTGGSIQSAIGCKQTSPGTENDPRRRVSD